MIQPSYINRGVRYWHETPTPFHETDEIKVVVSTRGTFIAETLHANYEVKTSSAVLIPPGLLHRFTGSNGPVEITVIAFLHPTKPWLSRLLPTGKPRVVRFHPLENSLLDELHRRWQQEKFLGDTFSQTSIEGLAQAWLSILMRVAERSEPSVSDSDVRLQIAHQCMASRFHEPLSIQNLARQAGLSEAHFRERYRLILVVQVAQAIPTEG